jgi:hypothetical protein
MDIENKKVPRETPPVTISIKKDGVGILLKNKAYLLLVQLYREDKDGLFWVLQSIRQKIQSDEANHLAELVIRKAKDAIPKA